MDYKTLMIKRLEDRHKISILIYLLHEGRSKKSEIYSNMPKNSDMASKLTDLQELGLLTLDCRKFENNTTYVELTTLGKSIAKEFQIAEDLMNRSLFEKSSINHAPPVEKNEPENKFDLPSERWKFMKRPCADTLLFTVLQASSITMAELKKKCKGEEEHLEDRIREAESLDLILGLHPDGPKSEIRYSLTVDGRNMAENLRRSMECQEVVSMDYDTPSKQENKVG